MSRLPPTTYYDILLASPMLYKLLPTFCECVHVLFLFFYNVTISFQVIFFNGKFESLTDH
ncbi:hypothetical protein HanRHA438_Chr13g0577801 [Helianthus annuus]|nr:hypothetical protein HanRHA438_Chr13g0577801 [Helianthus annuus]